MRHNRNNMKQRRMGARDGAARVEVAVPQNGMGHWWMKNPQQYHGVYGY